MQSRLKHLGVDDAQTLFDCLSISWSYYNKIKIWPNNWDRNGSQNTTCTRHHIPAAHQRFGTNKVLTKACVKCDWMNASTSCQDLLQGWITVLQHFFDHQTTHHDGISKQQMIWQVMLNLAPRQYSNQRESMFEIWLSYVLEVYSVLHFIAWILSSMKSCRWL